MTELGETLSTVWADVDGTVLPVSITALPVSITAERAARLDLAGGDDVTVRGRVTATRPLVHATD